MKKVDDYLNEVDYSFKGYKPSDEALKYIEFIKLVGGDDLENETPIVHYKIADAMFEPNKNTAILCHRGLAKCLDINVDILSPKGNIKLRDIRVGDIIYDREMKETRVTHISPIYDNKECYRITLKNSSSFIATVDHNHIVTDYENDIEYLYDTKYLYENYKKTRLYIPFLDTDNVLEINSRLRIIDIRKVPTIKTKCISVDSITKSYIFNEKYITHNTTLGAEFLILYVAAFGKFPHLGKVNFIMYVGDSIQNNVKSLRKNIEFRYDNSDYLKNLIPDCKIKIDDTTYSLNEVDKINKSGRNFTDVRFEFINKRNDILAVRLYGAMALSLDTRLFTDEGYTTIKDCKIGDKIYGSDGKLCTITDKSEIFYKSMYEIVLNDNRSIKVSEDHINSVIVKTKIKNKYVYMKKNLTTKELLSMNLTETIISKNNIEYIKSLVFIENIKAIDYSEKDLELEPYTLGLILSSSKIIKTKDTYKCELIIPSNDLRHYITYMPSNLEYKVISKNNKLTTLEILGINKFIVDNKLYENLDIPDIYLRSNIFQRIKLLRGLMDINATIDKVDLDITYITSNKNLANSICSLVRSLGGKSFYLKRVNSKNNTIYVVHIVINEIIFELDRKASMQRLNNKNIVAITQIRKIELEPSQCIKVDNIDHQFICSDYVRTHNTGVRGAKEYGKRPQIAIIDDIIRDEDSRSDIIINTIENTVHKAVKFALTPKNSKIIWLGTPFNARDPLYKATESGAYAVACYPVCEKFPCSKDEFKGSWEDRFDYE